MASPVALRQSAPDKGLLRTWLGRHQVLLDSLLILTLALALRLPNLEGWPRPIADEGAYGYTGYYYFWGQLGKPYLLPGFNAPLLMWVFGMMTAIFGRSFLVLRLPGALLGAFTCVLLYLVGRRLFGRGVGLLGGVFLALASTYVNRSALLDNGVAFFMMLALWGYLKFREQPRGRWGNLMGVAAGLATLSKYSGVMTPLFLFLQWLVDRRLPTRPLAGGLALFVALMAVYPLIATAIGWNHFLGDVFPVSRRGAEEVASLTEALFWQRPVNQLEWETRWGFTLWATGGFFSLFYLLGRGVRGGTVLVLVAAVVVTYAAIGSNFWWSYLITLYPAYCLALAVVAWDALVRPGISFLVVLLFFLLLPTVAGSAGPVASLPPGWGRWGLLLLLAMVLAPLLWRRLGLGGAPSAARSAPNFFPLLYRSLIVLAVGLSVAAASARDLRGLFSDAAADQRRVAAYLRANLREDQLATANPSVAYLVGERTIPYADVAFYSTRIEFRDYSLTERYPRFKQDVSLERMKYFVLDHPFTGLQEWNAILRPHLATNWSRVATIGDFQVYRNPDFPKEAILVRDDGLADATTVEVSLSDHLVVRNDALEKISGENSLRIDLALQEEHALRLYTLAEPEDWRPVEAVSFWWYGDQVGVVELDLLTPTPEAYYRLSFADDWQGWRQVELPLAQAVPVANPSWKAIQGATLKFLGLPVSGTVRLDELRLQPAR